MKYFNILVSIAQKIQLDNHIINNYSKFILYFKKALIVIWKKHIQIDLEILSFDSRTMSFKCFYASL